MGMKRSMPRPVPLPTTNSGIMPVLSQMAVLTADPSPDRKSLSALTIILPPAGSV